MPARAEVASLRRRPRCSVALLLYLALVAGSPPVLADHGQPGAVPWVSIIIDDIGYRQHEDVVALELPGPLAYAIMPHSPLATQMSDLANRRGKDVLLHLPMQAVERDKNRFLGPGALTLGMSRRQFIATVADDLYSFPHIIGVNNHMGSLLTTNPADMEWLMHFLKGKGKFYIDSFTSKYSVAGSIARENHIPSMRRDVFLDDVVDVDYINGQVDKLIEVAKQKGHAIAIGHPHAETLAVLAKRLPTLDKYGVRLVSLSRMVYAPVLQNRMVSTDHAADTGRGSTGQAGEEGSKQPGS
jgi:polysaccharide deacetylase 2 family uncharacterized protein YibQ